MASLARKKTESSRMRSLKVFVVDDDPDFAEGIGMSLENAGHDVTFASSGEEALEKYADQDYDITLMDVRMPGMNGVESLLKIRKMKPNAKIIMMTAYSVEDLLRQAITEGAVGVLHKPISSDTLLKALEAASPATVVLVADDDPDFTEGIQSTLSEAGYAVATARNGEQAVEMALNNTVDVLLLDIRMPVLNGLEVHRRLKEHGCNLPTIIVTGYATAESESIRQLMEMSAKGCLVKPIAASDLLSAIEDAV